MRDLWIIGLCQWLEGRAQRNQDSVSTKHCEEHHY